MARFRVRDRQRLRKRLAESERVVPHNVRSLAEEVEVSPALMGHLLTGIRETVDEQVAKRISKELKAPFEELFAPVESLSGNNDSSAQGPEQ